jgi:serine-type D-Ala-D-Ala carboxypeptidase (penicillin-binding protein 5/6)
MLFLVIDLKAIKQIAITLLLAVVLVGFWPTQNWAATSKPQVSAEAAILIDETTGTVLYEKNADRIMEPASITKVMTALLTLERLDLDTTVTIDRDMNIQGNGLDLKAGEKLTVKQLLYGMLVHSSNDAAVVLAEQLADTSAGFNKMANERAAELGATHTVYKNPNGLNDVQGHVTTARDLALICTEAMKNSTFRKIVSTVHYTIPANDISKKRTLLTTNKLLYDTKDTIVVNGEKRHPKYDGIMGVKTGETSTAGLCIVASAKRDGTQMMAVILNAPDADSRLVDAITLMDFGFENYYTYEAVKAGTEVGKAKIQRCSTIHVPVVVKGGYFITLPKEASESLVTQKIKYKENLEAPIKKGTAVGTITFYLADEKIGETSLVTTENAKKGGPWTVWGIPDWAAYGFLVLVFIVVLFITIRNRIRRKKRKKRERQRMLDEIRLEKEQRERLENKRKRDWPY